MYRGEFGAPCAIQNALIRFRAHPDVCSEFAAQLFRWCQQSGIFASIATQTTSIAHLSTGRFSTLKVQVPPLGEQRKIAEILGSVDEAIQATQAVIENDSRT
jgi:type I restriction enzyme, S subunit